MVVMARGMYACMCPKFTSNVQTIFEEMSSQFCILSTCGRGGGAQRGTT